MSLLSRHCSLTTAARVKAHNLRHVSVCLTCSLHVGFRTWKLPNFPLSANLVQVPFGYPFSACMLWNEFLHWSSVNVAKVEPETQWNIVVAKTRLKAIDTRDPR